MHVSTKALLLNYTSMNILKFNVLRYLNWKLWQQPYPYVSSLMKDQSI